MTSRTNRVRAAAALTAVLVGAGGLSACSDDPSEGWKQLEGDRLTLEYPEDWSESEGASEKWNLAVEAKDSTSIQVSDPFNNSPLVSDPLGTMGFAASMKLDDFDASSPKDFEVDGQDAVMQIFTYTDGKKHCKGAWFVVGQQEPRATVAVTVAGPGVDNELISHVKNSLEYEYSPQEVDTDGNPSGWGF